MNRRLLLDLLTVMLMAALWVGCSEEAPPSLYDPNYVSKPQPKITSVSPADSALAGATILTITGQNFAPVITDNIVYFDGSLGTVLAASETQLQVRPPNLVKDSVKIKIAVMGADLFSTPTFYIKLKAAYLEVSALSSADEPWGTTVDTLGNIYVSISGGGVKKIAPDGTLSTWAPSGGFTKWSALKLGKNNTIYSCLNLPAIFALTQGANPQIYVSPASGIGKVFDFDFDAQGNIWAGGDNADVYRVAPDKSVKSYPFLANARSVRVYAGYLYVAGRTYPDSAEKVVRFQITAGGDLGAAEVYFNLSTSSFGAGGKSIYAMNFTAQGDMLLGTDCTDPILKVSPTKTVAAFYPGLFKPTYHILPWGRGTEMIGVQGTASAGSVGTSQKLYRIETLLLGAPYYGRN